ncbi:hypothetical protein V5O48_015117 [Marasmius crinis-equi]|uniref:T6SS Phospholipase effector Tle1-like catalytic domain-containing protein n=1 Tax=Marasmius crinis-equi TaxID=585013 RepID=A0ABR3EVQ0_9AGAR
MPNPRHTQVGLIHKGNEEQLGFAFELYSKCGEHTASGGPEVRQYNARAEVFKKTFARDIRVHFVGVWDAVSAVGLRTSKPLPLTNNGMKHVCFFRHALALDETRVKFLPVYAKDMHDESLYTEQSKRAPMLLRKEVWFAGDHSDIGGGREANAFLTSNGPALRWMIKESSDAGLSFEPSDGAWATVSGQKLDLGRSRHWFYNFIEGVPMGWLTPTKSWWPHLNAKRELRNGQLIHESVYSMNPDYTKRLPGGWEKPDDRKIERDEFDKVSRKLSEYVRESRVDEDELRRLVRLESGHLAFLELLESLKAKQGNHGDFCAKISILNVVANHFQRKPALDIVSATPDLQGLLSHRDPQRRDVAKEYLKRFGNAQIDKISVGAVVTSVSFSPDRRYIAIASSRPDISLFDVHTGETKPLHGHNHAVSCIQFYSGYLHGKDTKYTLASGSLDGSVRIWEIGLGIRNQPEEEWKVHGGSGVGILSVRFSTDGKKVISSGLNCAVDVWHVDSDKKELHHMTSLDGHTRRVFSAEMSPSGDRVVSVSLDNTIRLWDTADEGTSLGGSKETSTLLAENTRHPKDPTDVVFLLFDGKDAFLTGTFRGEFTIWSAEDGAAVGTFVTPIGVSNSLHSFTLASELPRRLACGLSNGGITVWDIDARNVDEQEPKKLHDHAYHLEGRAPVPVTSIAFSRCNTRIISGLADGFAVIWHAEGTVGLIPLLEADPSLCPDADGDLSRRRLRNSTSPPTTIRQRNSSFITSIIDHTVRDRITTSNTNLLRSRPTAADERPSGILRTIWEELRSENPDEEF